MAKQNTTIKSFDELPAILTAQKISEVMGLSVPLTYELMNSNGFPVIRIGARRLIVPKDAFVSWLNKQSLINKP